MLRVLPCSHDGSVYKLRACIPGKLWQLNNHLLTDPTLLQSAPRTQGWVAVISPKPDKIQASV